MNTIVRLHHVQFTVPRDSEQAAREFYCNVMGLIEIPKAKELQSRGGFWLQLAGIQLHVGVEDNIDRAATKSHLAFQVTNLAKWQDHLARNGIKTLESIPIPGFARCEFRDPFGNRVELIEPIQPI
jgi:catechol 2,3-dioxygenase-like lactoylglutathione lyase family enzyme